MLTMKILKAFRLSEEAIAVLDKQRHATQFLEDLILSNAEKKMEVVPLHQLQALLEEFIPKGLTGTVVEVGPVTSSEFVPTAPYPTTGYPCCENTKAPCKHWPWDSNIGARVNTITGEVREPDGY